MENGETGPDVGQFLRIICVLSYQFARVSPIKYLTPCTFPVPA